MTTKVLSKEEFMKRYMDDKRKKEELEKRKKYLERETIDNYFYDSIQRSKRRGKK